MIVAGIDAGSRAIKAVLWHAEEKRILASGMLDQGIEQETLAQRLLEQLLDEARISRNDVACLIATGYGRNLIQFAQKTITEITCHACGVQHLVPDARTIIEIGGQDSKLIRLDESGKVFDFAMNDRCAAGTGRFLEVLATRLAVNPLTLGELASQSTTPAAISSMCVVFAETEIVGLLASGAAREDIAAGVQASVAQRIATLDGVEMNTPIVFTGGVALIPGMRHALETTLGHPVQTAPTPLMTGALGAALLAVPR